MFEEIKQRIIEATRSRKKMAMFHYQVLLHASDLINTDPVEFCVAVDAPKSYATEFRKMLGLAAIMRDNNSRIV